MTQITMLINDVAIARNAFLKLVEPISEKDANFKPGPDAWNIIEITEHLFWAEQGGIYGMWKTLEAIRNGQMERTEASNHQGMGIREIIDLTWKPKEEVPAVAAPRLGGTLAFWRVSLASLQQVLEAFGNYLKEDELRVQAHPHPISGAMDFHQRLEFLAFHISRHFGQVQNLIEANK